MSAHPAQFPSDTLHHVLPLDIFTEEIAYHVWESGECEDFLHYLMIHTAVLGSTSVSSFPLKLKKLCLGGEETFKLFTKVLNGHLQLREKNEDLAKVSPFSRVTDAEWKVALTSFPAKKWMNFRKKFNECFPNLEGLNLIFRENRNAGAVSRIGELLHSMNHIKMLHIKGILDNEDQSEEESNGHSDEDAMEIEDQEDKEPVDEILPGLSEALQRGKSLKVLFITTDSISNPVHLFREDDDGFYISSEERWVESLMRSCESLTQVLLFHSEEDFEKMLEEAPCGTVMRVWERTEDGVERKFGGLWAHWVISRNDPYDGSLGQPHIMNFIPFGCHDYDGMVKKCQEYELDY